MPINNARRWIFASVISLLVGILLTAAGYIINDMNNYWMIAVGLLIATTAVILLFIFAAQAKRIDALFNGHGLLAHWQFDADQHMQKAQTEYETRRARNKLLLIIVTGFFVVIGGVFAVFGFDNGEDVLGFLAILIIILGVVSMAAFLAPKAALHRQQSSPPDIYIGKFSAWVFGEYTQWKAPAAKPKKVVVSKSLQGVLLCVHFAIYTRYGMQNQTCRIPVPTDKETDAREVAIIIAQANSITLEESDRG